MFCDLGRLPLRPAPLDTHALLPLLRVQTAESAVEALVRALGNNVMAAARWYALNGGAADWRDPVHLTSPSPAGKLAEAQDALAAACGRYRRVTGQDGVELAHRILQGGYGAEVAAIALKLLEEPFAFLPTTPPPAAIDLPPLSAEELSAAIDELLSDEPEPPAPSPTLGQWQAGRSAIAEWMLSDPDLEGLAGALSRLLVALRGVSDPAADLRFERAVETVRAAVGAALACGFDPEAMQAALDCWAAATGGPRITVTIDAERE
jgi:hypothetical protein